jgi:hypothetical protein
LDGCGHSRFCYFEGFAFGNRGEAGGWLGECEVLFGRFSSLVGGGQLTFGREVGVRHSFDMRLDLLYPLLGFSRCAIKY